MKLSKKGFELVFLLLVGFIFCSMHPIASTILSLIGVALVLISVYFIFKALSKGDSLLVSKDDIFSQGMGNKSSFNDVFSRGMRNAEFPYFDKSEKLYYPEREDWEVVGSTVSKLNEDELDNLHLNFGLECIEAYKLDSNIVRKLYNEGTIKEINSFKGLSYLDCWAQEDSLCAVGKVSDITYKPFTYDINSLFGYWGRVVYDKSNDVFYVLSDSYDLFKTPERFVHYVKA